MISMQSLMSPNPYENEPGFEDAKSDFDKKNIEHYIQKVRGFLLPDEVESGHGPDINYV